MVVFSEEIEEEILVFNFKWRTDYIVNNIEDKIPEFLDA